MEIRLQKYLAEAGIASRRTCEKYIVEGKIKINGQVVTELGTKVNPDLDKIEYNNKLIKKTDKNFTYILLNKPIGYVTTMKDQFNRDIVLDLIKTDKRLIPVGRLDMYTSGALILTDDGEFIYRVTHPKNEITKTYTVTLKGIVTREDVELLKKGVDIGGFITSKSQVRILKTDLEQNKSRLEITIHEGKNRQVRKMCEAIGKKVLALHRSKIGSIGVKDLKIGNWRYLKQEEVDELMKN